MCCIGLFLLILKYFSEAAMKQVTGLWLRNTLNLIDVCSETVNKLEASFWNAIHITVITMAEQFFGISAKCVNKIKQGMRTYGLKCALDPGLKGTLVKLSRLKIKHLKMPSVSDAD